VFGVEFYGTCGFACSEVDYEEFRASELSEESGGVAGYEDY